MPPPGLIPKVGRVVVLTGGAMSPIGIGSFRIAMFSSDGGEGDRVGDGGAKANEGADGASIAAGAAERWYELGSGNGGGTSRSSSSSITSFSDFSLESDDHKGIDGSEERSFMSASRGEERSLPRTFLSFYILVRQDV